MDSAIGIKDLLLSALLGGFLTAAALWLLTMLTSTLAIVSAKSAGPSASMASVYTPSATQAATAKDSSSIETSSQGRTRRSHGSTGSLDGMMVEDESFRGFSMEEAKLLNHKGALTAKNRTPSEVVTSLQRGNTRFWMNKAVRPELSAFERRALIVNQYPSVAILGCSDSRVPVEIVFDQGLGDLFVIRVAGNCLDTAVTASIEYAVGILGVKVLVVMGHEGCGAVKAAMAVGRGPVVKNEPTQVSALQSLLTSIGNGLRSVPDIQDVRALDREAVAVNVTNQLDVLKENGTVSSAVTSGKLILIGAFYEISSGIVDFTAPVDCGGGASLPIAAKAL